MLFIKKASKLKVHTNRCWCVLCEIPKLIKNFKNWTSGNVDIDEFIKNTQLNAESYKGYLEWIPFDRFIIHEQGRFMYKATWKDGPRETEYHKGKCERTRSKNKKVALKKHKKTQLTELKYHYECSVKDKGFLPFYGITKCSDEYFLVFEYAEHGNLREYLQREEWKIMTIVDQLKILYDILNDLKTIHRNGLAHNGINSGNILITASKVKRAYICDLGSTRPENSKESDIYAIGKLIWEICNKHGKRPKFTVKYDIYKLLYRLATWCQNDNPIKRPTIDVTLRYVFNLLSFCQFPCNPCELPLLSVPPTSSPNFTPLHDIEALKTNLRLKVETILLKVKSTLMNSLKHRILTFGIFLAIVKNFLLAIIKSFLKEYSEI